MATRYNKGKYDQKKAFVHYVVEGFAGDVKERLRCFRCYRYMAQDQYYPIGTKMRRGVMYVMLHPYCRICRKQTRGRCVKHPNYTPKLDRFMARLLSRVRGGARQRGIAVVIDKDDLLELYFEQRAKCAVTGVDMKPGDKKGYEPSVDRIYSAGNYTQDNIQLVCSRVNIMKGDMTPVEFVSWCKRIVGADIRREQDILSAIGG